MNQLLLRILLLLLHLVLNFIGISYLLSYDWTGSWLRFFGFIVLVLLLFYLFVRHLLIFFHFLKPKP